MFEFLKSKTEKDRAIIVLLGCVLILILGYYILNKIATLEDPPFGNTLYIIIGSTLIAIGGLGVVMSLKYIYDFNKRKKRKQIKRKKHKIVFLKKEKIENK